MIQQLLIQKLNLHSSYNILNSSFFFCPIKSWKSRRTKWCQTYISAVNLCPLHFHFRGLGFPHLVFHFPIRVNKFQTNSDYLENCEQILQMTRQQKQCLWCLSESSCPKLARFPDGNMGWDVPATCGFQGNNVTVLFLPSSSSSPAECIPAERGTRGNSAISGKGR